MSWFKIFSAVLVANIVSWIIVTILGWFIFFVVLDSFNDALGKRLSTKPDIEFRQSPCPLHRPPRLSRFTLGRNEKSAWRMNVDGQSMRLQESETLFLKARRVATSGQHSTRKIATQRVGAIAIWRVLAIEICLTEGQVLAI